MQYPLYIIFLLFFCNCSDNNNKSTEQPTAPYSDLTTNTPKPDIKNNESPDSLYNQLFKKTLLLVTFLDKQSIAAGAGFIVNKGGSLFLVTNYHILTGFNFNDTTKAMDAIGVVPNKVRVIFHAKNSKEKIPKIYPLYTADKKRKFISVGKPNFPPFRYITSTIDLVALPLGKLPDNIEIDSIRLYDNKFPELKSNMTISFLGFRGKQLYDKQQCGIDVAQLAKHPYLNNLKSVIYFNAPKEDFNGNSGCPVYTNIEGVVHFIGIQSAVSNAPLPELDNGIHGEKSGIIISKSFIKLFLETTLL